MQVPKRIYALTNAAIDPGLRLLYGRRKRELLSDVEGKVVIEIGAGSGVNLTYFRGASRLILVEPPVNRHRKSLKLPVSSRIAR